MMQWYKGLVFIETIEKWICVYSIVKSRCTKWRILSGHSWTIGSRSGESGDGIDKSKFWIDSYKNIILLFERIQNRKSKKCTRFSLLSYYICRSKKLQISDKREIFYKTTFNIKDKKKTTFKKLRKQPNKSS